MKNVHMFPSKKVEMEGKNVFGHENRRIFLKISSNARETDMTTPYLQGEH